MGSARGQAGKFKTIDAHSNGHTLSKVRHATAKQLQEYEQCMGQIDQTKLRQVMVAPDGTDEEIHNYMQEAMEVVEATCNEQAVMIIGHKSKRRHKPKNKRSGNSIKAADLQNIVHAVENAVYTHDQFGCNAAYQRHIKVVQAFTIMHNGKRVDLDRGNLQHHRYVCKLRAAMPGLQMSMRRAVERNKVEVKRAAQHELQEVCESG